MPPSRVTAQLLDVEAPSKTLALLGSSQTQVGQTFLSTERGDTRRHVNETPS